MEQIVVKQEGRSGKVILTRFKGERTWSVVGHDSMGNKYKCYNGENGQFLKSKALAMADQWLKYGFTQL